jgi:transcriptional regulator with XRE-family HTH domain
MYNTEAVPVNIRSARLHKNYSQDYLACKLKISQNAYSKIELGYTKMSLDKLVIIAEVLEIELFKLLGKDDIKDDIEAISSIPMVPKLLEVICKTTGMGFAAIARVTEDKWVACSVRDEIPLGLGVGGELKIETTICSEIRETGEAVIIEHVDNNDIKHSKLARYGFKSYISMPIMRQNGSFFGTLCAIDFHPHKLNNTETIEMFRLFADLISLHLKFADFYQSEPIGARKITENRKQMTA